MPRKRQIDPDIWRSRQFVGLSRSARLLFIGMISLADDEGRLKGAPLDLRMCVLPGDNIRPDRVQKWRDECVKAGLVKLYESPEGEPLLWLPNWHKHQHVNRPYPSKLPAHPQDDGRVDETEHKAGKSVSKRYV